MSEQCNPYPTDDLVYYLGEIERPHETIELADVEAVDLLLPYAKGIGGGPFRTLRLALHEAGVRMTDFSGIDGNHREVGVPLEVSPLDAPVYDTVLEPGRAAIFGREHNPGHLPILERSFVSRQHFSLELSRSGLALTIRDLGSHNGMSIHPQRKLAAEYSHLFAPSR